MDEEQHYETTLAMDNLRFCFSEGYCTALSITFDYDRYSFSESVDINCT